MSKNNHATLCVEGTPATSFCNNDARLRLMDESMRAIKDSSIHTLVLPGGMFWSDQALFMLSPHDRCEAIGDTSVITNLMTLIPEGLTIITGLDICAPNKMEPFGQYSLAITKERVLAVSRKVFPTKGEVAKGAFTLPQDFADPSRIITACPTEKAPLIMHTCYDIFGSVDAKIGKSSSSRLGHLKSLDEAFCKKTSFQAYQNLLDDDLLHNKAVITVNIHDFDKPGRDIFYQRHGIASASAAFNGAVVLGAAHFKHSLPLSRANSTLCAQRVPKSHLSARFHRKAHHLEASELFEINTRDNNAQAVLRIFSL